MGELDLLITAVGEYTANSGVALNGVSGHFASIHVAVGVQNMFSFTFVESGTTTPVLLEDSVYDGVRRRCERRADFGRVGHVVRPC